MVAGSYPNLVWAEVWSTYQEVYDVEVADLRREMELDKKAEAEDEQYDNDNEEDENDDQGAGKCYERL